MAKVFQDFTPELCEKLLDFVYPNDENMTRQEVQAELHRLGIDIGPTWDKLKKALRQRKQREKSD